GGVVDVGVGAGRALDHPGQRRRGERGEIGRASGRESVYRRVVGAGYGDGQRRGVGDQTVGILDGVGEHVGGGDTGRQRVGGVLIGDVAVAAVGGERQVAVGAGQLGGGASRLTHRPHDGGSAACSQGAGGVVDVGVGAGRALDHPGQRRRGERG